MDDRDNETLVDVKLFKAIGLHQILRPAGGGRNWYRTAVLTFMSLSLALQMVQAYRLHLSSDDLQTFTFMAVVMIATVLCLYKGYVIVTKADRLRDVLDVARFAFTSCGDRHSNAFRRHRNTLNTLLRTFAGISYVTLVSWVVSPGVIQTETGDDDGRVGESPIADYVADRKLVFAVEGFVLSVNVFCWVLFDCYVVTLCFVLKAQFRTLSAEYRALGHDVGVEGSPSSCSTSAERVMKSDRLRDLISRVRDNQKIIKNHDDFFNIVQPVVYVQIVIGMNTIIGLLFLTMLTYLTGWPILSGPVMRLIAGAMSMVVQVYIYCYSFHQLETAKSEVNFELYSSNWIEQNLKFNNTILLAMNMNSSHKRTMKLSPKSIVNLEMFARLMNMSYTILSVLYNSSRKLNE